MVRAHRRIASKLPKGHRLFRLCFYATKDIGYPTFLPRIADWPACVGLHRNGGGGNS
jgi:hypothetical protein